MAYLRLGSWRKIYEYLSKHGYKLAESTPRLLTHETKDIKFTLVVNDFGVYYTNQQDVEELIRLLQDKYTITVDWGGTKYLGS